jgi:hypothetical protein
MILVSTAREMVFPRFSRTASFGPGPPSIGEPDPRDGTLAVCWRLNPLSWQMSAARKPARCHLNSKESHVLRRDLGTMVLVKQPRNREMTTQSERARALVWAGGFLIEVAKDSSLPLELRRKAATIARHFPTIELIAITSTFPPSTSPTHPSREDLTIWAAELQHGPLKESTRICWPDA